MPDQRPAASAPQAKPRLLDLFCCEGGAAMGYSRAGFEVVGIDLFTDYSQKRYPFRSIKMDALDAIADFEFLASFDAVHASPPCQHASGPADWSIFAQMSSSVFFLITPV
jgi:site-specific DNA-cytosine methylase